MVGPSNDHIMVEGCSHDLKGGVVFKGLQCFAPRLFLRDLTSNYEIRTCGLCVN